jgi:RNA polymerase-binding transcription factor DksA
MPETTVGPALDRATLTALAMELRRECARLERALASGDAWSEHHELLRALQRMDEGTYGTCVRCGRPIPLGRLQVMPATQHCLGCGR